MVDIFGYFFSHGFAFIFWGLLIFGGVKRYLSTRRNLPGNRRRYRSFNPPPTYNSYYAPPPYQPPTPLITQPPPNNGYGYSGPVNNYNLPGPFVFPGSNSDPAWHSPLPEAVWPDPPTSRSKVIEAYPQGPSEFTSNPPNSVTKDIFVWGRTLSGWIYAGKLTVVRNMDEDEIKRYADGKFGLELKDKLCIRADNFEQARYIFEQGRAF